MIEGMFEQKTKTNNPPQRSGWYRFITWFKSLNDGHQFAFIAVCIFISCWWIMALSIAGLGGWIAFKYTVLATGIILGIIGLIGAGIAFFVGMDDGSRGK